MKRSAIVVALALGLMAQGAMAKTLNVVSSFSVLGDIAQQVGGEHDHVDTLVGPAIHIPSTLRRKIVRCSARPTWWWLTAWGWKGGWIA